MTSKTSLEDYNNQAKLIAQKKQMYSNSSGCEAYKTAEKGSAEWLEAEETCRIIPTVCFNVRIKIEAIEKATKPRQRQRQNGRRQRQRLRWPVWKCKRLLMPR